MPALPGALLTPMNAGSADAAVAEVRRQADALYDLQLRLTGILDEEGVPLLAGTDAVGAGWVMAGSSRHREFDEPARAGVSE